MTLEHALRLTEILMALAFVQQSSEHLSATPDMRRLFILRILLCLALLFGVLTQWVLVALVGVTLVMLHRYQGPYNGGSDRMSLLILCCLCLARILPDIAMKEAAFGYLAIQLVLSYVISGWVKIVNPEWRRGRALRDVFAFSAYPVSEGLRGWANRPRLLLVMSWAVMLFELLFPLSLFNGPTLFAGLAIAATFHFSNACLFGLNRFFWIWLSAYPSILWLQERFATGG